MSPNLNYTSHTLTYIFGKRLAIGSGVSEGLNSSYGPILKIVGHKVAYH